MDAFLIKAPGTTAIVSREKPTPAADEVLLRIRTVGLCGSDLSTYRGMNPLVTYPRIPGHEIGATIEEVGLYVPDTLRPGINVTATPYTSCGRCLPCKHGRYNCCRSNETLGVQRDGALTEYIVVPWKKVIAGDGLSLPELALIEPLSVGFHAVDRARISSSDTVVVLGCGMIGLGVVAGAVFRRARVVAVDIDNLKLDIARQAGATDSINTANLSLHDALHCKTSGEGPEVIIEAIGLPEMFRAAVEEVAFAGRVVYVGYSKNPVTYDAAIIVKKELDVLGSRNAIPEDFSAVVDMLHRRHFPVDSVITQTVPLDHAGKILEAWHTLPQAFTKIQITID